MFIKNKYTTWYYKIINHAKSQERKKLDNEYFESHHIIPKCMNGTETVLLTGREHYICHLLLPKMVKDKKHYYQMICALNRMCKLMTSRMYEHMRKYNAEASRYFVKNHKRTQQHCKNLSNSHKAEKNPMYGKTQSTFQKETLRKFHSKGTFITPWGTFLSARQASLHPNACCARETITRKCKKNKNGYFLQ